MYWSLSLVCIGSVVYLLSHVPLFCHPWTVASWASQSTGFPMQKYQIGLPFPSPGDIPDPGIEPVSPEW